MFDPLFIKSYKGIYRASFVPDLLKNEAVRIFEEGAHYIVDKKVAILYSEPLSKILKNKNTTIIEATEDNKSLENIIPIVRLLLENKFRRGNILIGVGGGVIQDITCFIASILLRGVEWRFVPTTLLSQADSVIGSKSSINLTGVKNVLGTFYPPNEIWICQGFIETLDIKEIRSGIGEIIKVHAISGKQALTRLAKDYDYLISDSGLLGSYIYQSLEIKKKYIELDEFDTGLRNIFNYGHSFGHAIEAATRFLIPHGVAVSMGMDIANKISVMRGLVSQDHYYYMHDLLQKNYACSQNVSIPICDMLTALLKDKKNTNTNLVLVLPTGKDAQVRCVNVPFDEDFRSQLDEAIKGLKE